MDKLIKLLWFLLFLTITTYAIAEIRIVSLPLPLFFLIILIPLIIHKKRDNKKLFYFNIILLIYIFLSMTINIINQCDFDYSLRQLIYPLSTLIIANFLDDKYLKSSLTALYLSSILIFFYGLYGFVTWKVGDPIQHTFGYFGITYLESTRNGDLIYLFPGLFASFINMYNNKNRSIRILNLIFFIFFLLAVIANQSRGGFIVIFFSALFLIRNKKKYLKKLSLPIKIFMISFFLLSIFAFINFFDKSSLQIITERFFTIFSTKDNTTSTYNSNSERLDILLLAFHTFFENIFGIGITGLSKKTNGSLFHAENAYVSILVYYGFIGAFLFSLMLFQVKKILNLNSLNYNNIYIKLLFYFLTIYSLFNLMIDMLPFWIILGLVSININKNHSFED